MNAEVYKVGFNGICGLLCLFDFSKALAFSCIKLFKQIPRAWKAQCGNAKQSIRLGYQNRWAEKKKFYNFYGLIAKQRNPICNMLHMLLQSFRPFIILLDFEIFNKYICIQYTFLNASLELKDLLLLSFQIPHWVFKRGLARFSEASLMMLKTGMIFRNLSV